MELTLLGYILILLAEFALGGGLLAGYIKLRKLRGEIRLIDAQTDKTASESWVLLVESLSNRVTTLEAQLEIREREREKERQEYTQRIDDLEAELEELREWIKTRGLKPPPRRKKRDADG